jgi:putative endopeptidase
MPFAHRALLLVPLLLILDVPADATAAKPKKARLAATAPVPAVCSDYYDTVNADWIKAHPAPATGSVSAFDTIITNARSQQQALLEDLARSPRDDTQRTLALLWADGMNENAIENAGAAPLQPLFARIAMAKKSRDITGVIADLHAAGVPVVFNFGADADAGDPSHRIGYASQGGIGLPDPEFYTRTDAETRAMLGRYRAYVETILRASGTPAEKVTLESGWVLGVEMQLAQSSPSLLQQRDPGSAFRPVSLRDLAKVYPNLGFDKFVRAQHLDVDRISLAQDGFFRTADGMLASVPLEQWQAYLRFHVANALAPYLSRAFHDPHADLYDRVLAGDVQPKPHAQAVLEAIDHAVGDAMGRAYAERYLTPATKDGVMRVAERVRGAMHGAIERSAWMDDATRATAFAKLDKLRIEIGEPEDAPSLSGLAVGNGFASDMLAVAAWQHQRDMASIGKRSGAPPWSVRAQTPYAGYDLVQNRLVITAALLQAPVFDASSPPATQYGALGALIGQQLEHVVDGKGRGIDVDGRFRDWWTPSTAAAYEQRTAAIVAQYDAYPSQGTARIDGRATRDENLADLAGVELALDAFHAAMPSSAASTVPAPQAASAHHAATKRGAKPAPTPPSQDVAFFAAYAVVWARSDAPDAADAAAGLQSPAKYRVEGPLANLPEFGKAHACKPGQPMMRATPVSIWR